MLTIGNHSCIRAAARRRQPDHAALEGRLSKTARRPYFRPTFMNCVGPNGSILKPVTFLLIG
jgi:hypothetical protein